jgi:hypothetical protein
MQPDCHVRAVWFHGERKMTKQSMEDNMNCMNETAVNRQDMSLLYYAYEERTSSMSIGRANQNLFRRGVIGRTFKWLKEVKDEISNAKMSFEPLIDFPRDI